VIFFYWNMSTILIYLLSSFVIGILASVIILFTFFHLYDISECYSFTTNQLSEHEKNISNVAIIRNEEIEWEECERRRKEITLEQLEYKNKYLSAS
jgi:hypothetical protein